MSDQYVRVFGDPTSARPAPAPIFRVTAVGPEPDIYMPTIEQYTALAEAIHDESDDCNANYQMLFHACPFREQDIEQAIRVLTALHKADWTLSHDHTWTLGMGL